MTSSIAWFASLYAAFALKHYLADFVLQLDWMVLGKEQARGWAAALAAHAGCHAVLTLLLVLVIAPGLWWLGPVDFFIHGGIDRGKAWALRRLDAERRLLVADVRRRSVASPPHPLRFYCTDCRDVMPPPRASCDRATVSPAEGGEIVANRTFRPMTMFASMAAVGGEADIGPKRPKRH